MTRHRAAALAFHIAVALAALGTAQPTPAIAQARTPLLMDGKTSLYQRVLTRPGAQLSAQPGGAAGQAVPALSQYYVYERRPLDGAEWLAVGAGSRGSVDGWVRAEATLPWKSQMALVFTNPAARAPTLLFEKRETVLELLQAPDPGAAVQPIRDAVAAGKPDARVVSVEPSTYIDPAKQFYLLPILQAQEVESEGFRVRVLEVASVTKKTDERSPADAKAASNPQVGALRTFSAAVVFVIDSTISMGPYIERTKQAVRRIYDDDREERRRRTGQVRPDRVSLQRQRGPRPGIRGQGLRRPQPGAGRPGLPETGRGPGARQGLEREVRRGPLRGPHAGGQRHRLGPLRRPLPGAGDRRRRDRRRRQAVEHQARRRRGAPRAGAARHRPLRAAPEDAGGKERPSLRRARLQ